MPISWEELSQISEYALPHPPCPGTSLPSMRKITNRFSSVACSQIVQSTCPAITPRCRDAPLVRRAQLSHSPIGVVASKVPVSPAHLGRCRIAGNGNRDPVQLPVPARTRPRRPDMWHGGWQELLEPPPPRTWADKWKKYGNNGSFLDIWMSDGSLATHV